MQFICFFTPAFLSLLFIYKIDKSKKFEFKYIIYYFNIVLLINLLNSLVLNLVFKNGAYLLDNNSFTNSFILKYFIISIFFSIVISYLYYVIKNKKIEIKFDCLKISKKKVKK